MKRLTLALFLWAAAAPAAAQELKLQIKDGQVNLQAEAVTVRRILAEWERIGGTRVSGLDRIPDEWLTLRLVSVPERGALDTILRNVAGYMAESRGAGSPAGASMYGRLWIMVASAPPDAVGVVAAAHVTPADQSLTASEVPEFQVAADGYSGGLPPGHLAATGAAGLPAHAPMPPPVSAAGLVVQGQMGRRGEPGSRPPAESMLRPAPFPTAPVFPNPKK